MVTGATLSLVLIGVDASRVTRPRRTGTENYSLRVLGELLAEDQRHAYRLYLSQPLPKGLLPIGPRTSTRLIRLPRLWTQLGLSAEMLVSPPDVLFVPSHVLPLVTPARSVVVVYDVGHRFYPSNWTAECGPIEPDETRYFIKHPGPTRAFADWVKARGIRWLAIDAGSADHPMNTVIRQVRPDHAKKCALALGRPLEEIWPDDDIQVMHYDLFPHEIIHIENAGGQIDRILDQRVTVGCFPWRFMGGEAAFCRFVAFV